MPVSKPKLTASEESRASRAQRTAAGKWNRFDRQGSYSKNKRNLDEVCVLYGCRRVSEEGWQALVVSLLVAPPDPRWKNHGHHEEEEDTEPPIGGVEGMENRVT